MKLICESDIDLNEWNEFVANSEYASPFQTPEFHRVYNSVAGQSAMVLAVRNGPTLVALSVITIQKEPGMKGYFSRRGIIYGGPLIVNSSAEALKCLMEGIKEKLKNEVIYLEIRNSFSYKQYKQVLENEKWHYIPYLNSEIDLQQKTLDGLLSSMKYNRRREINQSLKSGAIYKSATSEGEIKELYDILQDLYKKRVKLPLPSFDYFRHLFYSKIGKVFIVKHNNRIIGGSFCYYLKGGSIYTLYYCGIRDYDKKIFPTHLAIVAALDFGITEKLNKLDFMGAGKPGLEYGVRQYKLEFGGEQVEYGRYLLVNNPVLYKAGIFALKLKKMLGS